MNDNRSVATIDNPEFIDVKPFNPLISQCQIKVLYLGRNRNGSFIDKNTAIQMANSLPGCPIVGAWREDIEDFGDHGHVMTIEDGQIKFSCKTRPYGFVAPDARVWFQKYVDTDEFGEEYEREYMMTTGYLWTGQYEEAMSVIEEGKGQSMELDESSLDGHWANDSKTGMDFFIINDAIFSKLCILGDDVEPCFEGASVESTYAADADFAHSLYNMMKQLQETLEQSKGGLNMPKDFVAGNNSEEVQEQSEVAETLEEEATETVEEHETETENVEEEETAETDEDAESDGDEDEDASDEDESDDDDADTDFVAKKEEGADSTEPVAEEDEDKDEEDVTENACGDKKKYSLTEEEFSAIQSELESLRAFKLSIENKEKDALIDKYHMLSDEDKADIIAHKEEYTLEQIEEKLALVYVKNNVDFSTVDGHKETNKEEVESLLNFSLDDSNDSAEVVSDMQAAFREMEL